MFRVVYKSDEEFENYMLYNRSQHPFCYSYVQNGNECIDTDMLKENKILELTSNNIYEAAAQKKHDIEIGKHVLDRDYEGITHAKDLMSIVREHYCPSPDGILTMISMLYEEDENVQDFSKTVFMDTLKKIGYDHIRDMAVILKKLDEPETLDYSDFCRAVHYMYRDDYEAEEARLREEEKSRV